MDRTSLGTGQFGLSRRGGYLVAKAGPRIGY